VHTHHHPKIANTPLEKIAHYRIVRMLGQGGMSIVYEALDEKLKRPVAIKVLHPFLAEGVEYRLRFLREAEAVARLTHPNIVQIFDVANSDSSEHLYIVTELLFGETLKDYVTRVKLVELPELSAMIIWQMAQALEHAHQKGIIHRDIKPENIMVLKDGQLKLMDFGIASLGSEESLTQTGSLLGSLCHLSPELIKGHKATARSDIFSLTTVFFWLLTERLPFIGDSPHALLKTIVDTPHERVQLMSAYVSDDLAHIVDRGMSKDAALRFVSMLAMADAIEAALANLGIALDTQRMQATLRESKVAQFKAYLYDQMKKELSGPAENGDVAKRLALTCRLDAGLTKDPSQLPQKKPSLIKRTIWFAVAASLLILGLDPRTWQLLSQGTHEAPPITAKTSSESPEPVDLTAPDQTLPYGPLFLKEPERPEINIPDKKALKVSMQEIAIVVWPFANIFLDGKLLGEDKKSLSLRLSPGKYKLTFAHRYAATIEKLITVKDTASPMEINVQMVKSKPAFLRVVTNIDADVAVGGSYKGSTKKSVSRPVVIPLPDKHHSQIKEVFLSKDGYQPVILEVEFVAGQIKDLSIKLVPIS